MVVRELRLWVLGVTASACAPLCYGAALTAAPVVGTSADAAVSMDTASSSAAVGTSADSGAATTVDAASDSAGSDGSQLQEVVVTAQKRTQDIQNVPISISAIGGNQLQAEHIATYDDISRAVPGVSFNSLAGTEGMDNIEIRGVSSTAGTATTGIYLDDVSITTPNLFGDGAAQPQLFDLDRLEILRGPQGTLYGDSSEGGTIRFITQQPNLDQWDSQLTSDESLTEHAPNPNYFEGAIVNAPVVPGVFALRASVGFTADSGYIDHFSNPAQSDPYTLTQLGGSPQLLESGANWEQLLVAHVNGLIRISDAVQLLPAFFFQSAKTGDNSAFYPSLGLWQQDKEVPEPGIDNLWLPSLTINAHLGFADLTSVTGEFVRQFTRQEDGTFYNSTAFAGLIDVPCPAPGPGVITYPNGSPNCDSAQAGAVDSIIANLPSPVHFASHYGQLSQELRLASTQSSRGPQWVVGLYFQNQWIHNVNFQRIPGINTAFQDIFGMPMEDTYVNSVYGAPGVSQLFPDDIDESDNRFYNEYEYAAFGQVNFDLLRRLHVSVGARYAESTESFTSTEIGFYQIGNIDPYYQSGTFDAFLPKGTLTYDLASGSNVYASAAKGFRMGGPTGPITFGPTSVCNPDFEYYGVTQQPTKFDSDHLWTYELGSKNRLDANRLQIDGAVYTTRWSDIQQDFYLPTCGYYFTANAGNADIYGGELEIQYRAAEHLTLGLSGDAEHAYIASTDNPHLATVGAWLIDVPQYTYDATATYNQPLSGGRELSGQVAWTYTGKSYGSYALQTYNDFLGTYVPNPNYVNPGYGVLNVSVGLIGSRYEVTLYARNLANDVKIIQEPQINTVYEGYTVYPRTVGLTLKYRLQ